MRTGRGFPTCNYAIAVYTTEAYNTSMLTIAETSGFSARWRDYWTDDEFGEFCAWLAVNPKAGDVIPKSGGCRKVRWARRGRGKSGGVRVIYYNELEDGKIWLLVIYAKSVRATIPAPVLAKIRETIHGKDD